MKRFLSNFGRRSAGEFQLQKGVLEKYQTDDFERFPWKDREILAKVCSVYDGDTITVGVMLDSTPTQWRIRVKGIDCAELPRRKDGSDRSAEETQMAKLAKEFTTNFLTEYVIVVPEKYEFYSRILAEVYRVENETKGASLADTLLAEGLAVECDGKRPTTDWNEKLEKLSLSDEK